MFDLVAIRKRFGNFSVLAVCISLFGCTAWAQSTENVRRVGVSPPAGAPVKDIEMSAKKYEFTPKRVEVPINTLVRIHLSATDREHGFELKDVKNSCVTYKPREPVTVEFYVDRSGEWEFRCCKFCGLGHGRIKGVLVVKGTGAIVHSAGCDAPPHGCMGSTADGLAGREGDYFHALLPGQIGECFRSSRQYRECSKVHGNDPLDAE